MSTTEPITSAKDFADGLSGVVNRYMKHLEPTADDQTYGVKMTVTGERLNISFNKAPGNSPYIAFTLQQETELVEDTDPGLFGRKR